jgi:hypothetical protein
MKMKINIDEMDALHREGRARYLSHEYHSKFFALVDKEQMYYLWSGRYLPVDHGLEGRSE